MSNLGLQSMVVGELQTNCYLLWCENTREAVIIDPGDAGESIAEQILTLQLQPQAILLTHAHFDHVLGSLALQMSFDIPIYLHHADTELLKNAHNSAEHWLKHQVDPVPEANFPLEHNQEITFGECSVRVLHTPGHTPGSCSFLYQPDSTPDTEEQFKFTELPYLFDGDVIFKDGIGETKHSYSNKKEMFASLRAIKDLGVVRIFPGHGESFVSSDQEVLG